MAELQCHGCFNWVLAQGQPKLPRRKGGKLHEAKFSLIQNQWPLFATALEKQVLHKAVAVRYLPSTTADMAAALGKLLTVSAFAQNAKCSDEVGTRILGQLVELFEESAWCQDESLMDRDCILQTTISHTERIISVLDFLRLKFAEA